MIHGTARAIVVVGSLNLDLVLRVERLPRAGETITASSLQSFPGGKGANQAVAAARLGANVVMIGLVGDDAAGEQLRTALRQAGVDDRAVETVSGPSGTALIHTDATGENAITVVPGANGLWTPERVERHADQISSASIVLGQLEVPLPAVRRIAELCKASDVPFVLDPAPAMRLPRDLLQRVDWLTPNELEAETLSGKQETVDKAAQEDDDLLVQKLRAQGARNVLLKQGARGTWVAMHARPSFRSPGFLVEPVDTTAAGDCFNGAFAVAMSREDDLAAAVRFANAAAALSVTRAGAQPSMPTLEEVQDLLHREGA